jgi:chromosome segregation ATPase
MRSLLDILLLITIVALVGYGAKFYQTRYQPLQREHAQLRADLEQSRRERASVERALQEHVSQLEHGLQVLGQEKAGLQNELEKAHESWKALEEKRKKQVSDLQMAREACNGEKSQLLSAQTAAEKQVEDLTQTLAAQEDLLGELQAQEGGKLQEFEQTLAGKDRLIQELETRLATLAKNTADKHLEKETLDREVARLKPALQAAQARVYMLEQEGQKAEQACKAVAEEQIRQLDTLRRDLAGAERRTQELRQRVSEAGVSQVRWDQEKAARDREITTLQSALREAQTRIRSLEQPARPGNNAPSQQQPPERPQNM